MTVLLVAEMLVNLTMALEYSQATKSLAARGGGTVLFNTTVGDLFNL